MIFSILRKKSGAVHPRSATRKRVRPEPYVTALSEAVDNRVESRRCRLGPLSNYTVRAYVEAIPLEAIVDVFHAPTPLIANEYTRLFPVPSTTSSVAPGVK